MSTAELRELRPLPQAVRDSWSLVVAHWPVWLAAQGVQFALMVGLGVVVGGTLWIAKQVVASLHNGAMSVLLWIGAGALAAALLVFILATAAWAVTVTTRSFAGDAKNPLSLPDAFRRGLQGLVAAALMQAWIALLLYGSMMPFFFPVFLLLPRLIPAWFLVVLDGRPLTVALLESWQRTSTAWTEICGRCLLLVGSVLIVLLIFGAMPMLAPSTTVIVLVLQTMLQVLAPVYLLAFSYLIYRDLAPKIAAPATPDLAGIAAAVPQLLLPALYGLAAWGAVIILGSLGAAATVVLHRP